MADLDLVAIPAELLDAARPIDPARWWPVDDADGPAWRAELLAALVTGWPALDREARRAVRRMLAGA